MLLLLALFACAPDDPKGGGDGAPSTTTAGATGSSQAPGDTATDATVPPDPRVEAIAAEMSWDVLRTHTDQWAAIAAANDGNRAAGTSGYAASVDYAVEVLEGAGYAVERWPFELEWIELGDEALEADGVPVDDLSAFYGSGGGDVTAPITAIDVLLPPSDDEASTSGCEADDFADFPAGNIALIQRGSCLFVDKVANAVDAGAVAVVIFNEGNTGRTETLEGVLDGSTLAAVPVVGTSFAIGEAWVNEPPAEVRVLVEAELVVADSWNVFAETAGGSADHTVLVGGHLDSVPAGPGVNDDGSGAAFVLALAQAMADTGLGDEVRLKFALWGAEELGLIGSSRWVADMAAREPSELDRLDAYLNFDMIASPNGVPFVYDGDGDAGFALFPPVFSPPGSEDIEDRFVAALERDGVPWYPVSAGVPSDSLPFQDVGVPTGGLFSGAANRKTSGEAAGWGGDANVDYDVCYHRECDDAENLDVALFEALARAGAATAVDQALAAVPSGPPADRTDARTGPRASSLARWHDHGPGKSCGGPALPHR